MRDIFCGRSISYKTDPAGCFKYLIVSQACLFIPFFFFKLSRVQCILEPLTKHLAILDPQNPLINYFSVRNCKKFGRAVRKEG